MQIEPTFHTKQALMVNLLRIPGSWIDPLIPTTIQMQTVVMGKHHNNIQSLDITFTKLPK